MDLLPSLLGTAVLLPLISFAIILLAGPRLGKAGEHAGWVATGAILGALVCSIVSLLIWLNAHWPEGSHHGSDHAVVHVDAEAGHSQAESGGEHASGESAPDAHGGNDGADQVDGEHGADLAADQEDHHAEIEPITGNWYTLGIFGRLKLTIGYYIDALTVCMFCMVTLISSCIHFYSMGYMHEELHDVTDHEVTLSDGSHLKRPGRYHRFFQFLSLFCFSMLGLVVSGNVAMTFVFWELVGICSYFLIGFYVERKSASNAANKAFIVNRIGDFGMIIGLMALWSSLGTLSFGDIPGEPAGLFSQVRPAGADGSHALVVPAGMVEAAAADEVARVVRANAGADDDVVRAAIDAEVETWRDPVKSGRPGGYGRWLLIVAGVGIFCGCVGKSAQFPLHVWLPDAMEGPTPVSALVHSATMVAAGVYLVGRFYPVFAPEVLLVIAIVGCITLFLAATIAITATDIKRVLAYSTVSQLGYMMLALGVGGWLAGMLHLFTHAFFKSLLFMCSGSVIHAVHTNELTLMGGLRRKMPWTAYTMLVGCLAIAGAGIPFVIGFSGYYSKDSILEQALLFKNTNPAWGSIFFYAAAGGAAITAFYMFRLWYLTFVGPPRDQHRYDHAHESPPVMYLPLVVLAVFAIGLAWGINHAFTQLHDAIVGAVIAILVLAGIWLFRVRSAGQSAAHSGGEAHGHSEEESASSTVPWGIALFVLLLGLAWQFGSDLSLPNLLEQARPAGILANQQAVLVGMTWPSEADSHAPEIKNPATMIAFGTALSGFLLATVLYGWRLLDPEDARRTFAPVYRLLINKWWFDELYDLIFVRPTHFIAKLAAGFDRRWIDGLIDGLAWVVRTFSSIWERVADQIIVDGFVNAFARWTYSTGVSLRSLQTGKLRQYVMFIVVGTVVVFALTSFVWNTYVH